jgi:hypothetical protein
MLRLFGGVLALVAGMLWTTAAFACGDKLMFLLGGVRFRQIASAHPASILAYTRENSAVPAVVRNLEMQPTLRRAGYRVTAVESPARFAEELKTGFFDVVLIDASDADALGEQARLAPSKPALLPVVSKSNKVEAAAARKKFRRVLNTPSNANDYLDTIDDALEIRSKAGSPKK